MRRSSFLDQTGGRFHFKKGPKKICRRLLSARMVFHQTGKAFRDVYAQWAQRSIDPWRVNGLDMPVEKSVQRFIVTRLLILVTLTLLATSPPASAAIQLRGAALELVANAAVDEKGSTVEVVDKATGSLSEGDDIGSFEVYRVEAFAKGNYVERIDPECNCLVSESNDAYAAASGLSGFVPQGGQYVVFADYSAQTYDPFGVGGATTPSARAGAQFTLSLELTTPYRYFLSVELSPASMNIVQFAGEVDLTSSDQPIALESYSGTLAAGRVYDLNVEAAVCAPDCGGLESGQFMARLTLVPVPLPTPALLLSSALVVVVRQRRPASQN